MGNVGCRCCSENGVETPVEVQGMYDGFDSKVSSSVFSSVLQVPTRNTDPKQLVIGFILPGDVLRDITFTRRPLGLDFDKMAPIIIKKVQPQSHGESVGVQPGWRLKYVNGEDVSSMTFDAQFDFLRKVSAGLAPV
mmetsp:Transcript_22437/g.43046  ORF Transcript_22437/g.43046 Transcript_22437/m.43046 type:complete len:136 (-) Transcript_22437:92-499(-)